ncbi:MAG: metal/formaldehyde-sensitive transcriptional repressor [Devosia sp.]|uniref:metal/formaldehyde-sensitive transcriptional repressor n=1 Tax=Devosia sp. 66-22 TaxID=1895753 RepID=UPI0009271765|nr:metal/formaldehyde-sensitive transcriptional repressor [Devosia sp. 66-22]MBN9348049.1 metal/formaldehyde-sensitive transcriptional repressor [Devosia sp.]OJX46541.1 MAG: transcriptional regulator [Devosia sp. 66-22]
MTHTIKEKAKLLARVRRIQGQMLAVERALEEEIGCADVLQLVASVRGAVAGLTAELIEDHVRLHLLDDDASRKERAAAGQELIDVVRTYMR